MKKVFAILFALLLMLGAAHAETDYVYSVKPAECNVSALHAICFGEGAKVESRKNSADRVIYHLTEKTESVPFCGVGPYNAQMSQNIITLLRYSGEEYQHKLSWNVFPNGTAPGTVSADQAKTIADAFAPQIGLDGAQYLFTTAYGRIENAAPEYKITYVQRLNGLPVYWGAAVSNDDEADAWAESTNRMDVVIHANTGEVIELEAQWSAFASMGDPQELITEDQAASTFAEMRIEVLNLERCYWMTPLTGEDAKAYPAYRNGNSYLNALTGEWLQLDTSALKN